jgi:hypothetical protein
VKFNPPNSAPYPGIFAPTSFLTTEGIAQFCLNDKCLVQGLEAAQKSTRNFVDYPSFKGTIGIPKELESQFREVSTLRKLSWNII